MEATAAARLGAGDALDHGLDLVRVAWRLAPCTPAEQQLADNGLINVAPEQSLTPACARRRGRSPSRPGLEDAGRQPQQRVDVALVKQLASHSLAGAALEEHVVRHHDRRTHPNLPPPRTPHQIAVVGWGWWESSDQATPKDGVLAELMHEQRLEHWRATGHTASRVPTTDPSSASAISESASTSSSPHPTR
jgi:hypothetical protein